REIERDALAPAGGIDRMVVDLEAAHAKVLLARQRADMVARFDCSALGRACDDHPVALQDERAVHGEAEISLRRGPADLTQTRDDLVTYFGEPLSGHGGEGEHRGVLQGRAERK